MNLKVIPIDRAQIYLLFYKPTSSDPFQNRLVAHFDSPFSHVEMAFPERYGEEIWEKEIWGSSIYQGEAVFFKPKTYQRSGYVSFAIEVNVAQMCKIKSYCRQQTENKTPFSKLAMYAAYVPFEIYKTNATFCSKHVTMALQYGGINGLMDLNPNYTTPSRLFKALASRDPIVQVVPSRMFPENSLVCCSNMIKDMVNKNKQREACSVTP
jgi:hypothetical protein